MSGSFRARRFAIAGLALAAACFGASSAAPLAVAPPAVSSFDGGTLHVDVYGHGPQNVVFIPGLASGPWSWFGTIDALLAGGGSDRYTIYSLTLPGFDGHAPSAKRPLFDAVASDFWALLAAKNVTKPVVVGHSLGGTLAIALAEQHPERLAGIVAVDGLPVFPALAGATPAQRQAVAQQLDATFATLDEAGLLSAERKYMAAVATNQPSLVDVMAADAARSDAKSIGEWASEDALTDLRPALNRIDIPFVEIMPYDPSDAVPPTNYTQAQTQAFYESLLAGAPTARVVAIAPARHFVMLDRPEAFDAALIQFLTSVTAHS